MLILRATENFGCATYSATYVRGEASWSSSGKAAWKSFKSTGPFLIFDFQILNLYYGRQHKSRIRDRTGRWNCAAAVCAQARRGSGFALRHCYGNGYHHQPSQTFWELAQIANSDIRPEIQRHQLLCFLLAALLAPTRFDLRTF